MGVFVPIWLVLPRREATNWGVFDLRHFALLKRELCKFGWVSSSLNLNMKFLGGIFLGHQEPRRSRDLGQDVPDLEKLYARELWADFFSNWTRGHWKRGICIKLSEIDFQIRDKFAHPSSAVRNDIPAILRKIWRAICDKFAQRPPRERPLLGISDFRSLMIPEFSDNSKYINDLRACSDMKPRSVASSRIPGVAPRTAPRIEFRCNGHALDRVSQIQTLTKPAKMPRKYHSLSSQGLWTIFGLFATYRHDSARPPRPSNDLPVALEFRMSQVVSAIPRVALGATHDSKSCSKNGLFAPRAFPFFGPKNGPLPGRRVAIQG